MTDLLEDVYKNPPRDEPMGDGFTPHFNKLKFCALAGVHFLYRRGWEPKKLFAFCPPLASLPNASTATWTGACDAGAGRGDGSKDQAVCGNNDHRVGPGMPGPALYGKRGGKGKAAGRGMPAPTTLRQDKQLCQIKRDPPVNPSPGM